MKKLSLFCILCVVIILFCTSISAFAQHAGGGGNFGVPKEEQEQQEEPMTEEDASAMFVNLLQILIYGGTPITAYLIYEQKLSKSARASKRIMNMLDQKDSAWKFKNIMPRFKKIFTSVKNAWSQYDLDAADLFVTESMSEKLKMQQAWADMRQQSCELKYIKLLDARPVGVFDSHDDACDHIWFYVEWSALENDSKYGTSKTLKRYKEFWQLMRCGENWKLSDIIDKESGDNLIFGQENIPHRTNKKE